MSVVEKVSPQREQFAPGWYQDLENERYHASSGWSSSKIKSLLEQTPAHLAHGLTVKQEATAAMARGTALHTLILEPHRFHEQYAVHGKWDNRSNAGKAERLAFEAKHEGKGFISEAEFEKCSAMAAAVLADPVARSLVTDGIAESSVYWWYKSMDADDDERYQIMTKVRPDFLPRAYPVIVDIKTADDASYSGFSRSIEKYGYHISAAMYLEGVNQCQPLLTSMGNMAKTKFVFVVVESTAPYLVATYELSSEYLEIGKAKYRMCMRKLQEAMRDGFTGYPPLRVIEPTPWAHKSFVV